MRLSHDLAKTHASFDDPNLVSRAGLVPVMALAEKAGLADLVSEHVSTGGPCGVNAHLKVGCLVAGMAAGADSIDDLDVLRHGAMSELFGGIRAPSTLGSFLRSFTWGNVRQLDAVARRMLAELARQAPLLPGGGGAGVHRHRLDAKTGLRARQAGRRVRAHQDPGQEPADPRPERAGRRGLHAAGRPGDRGDPAARRHRELRPRRRVAGRARRSARPARPGALAS